MDKLEGNSSKDEFDELDKFHCKMDELDKLYCKFDELDKLGRRLISWIS